MHFLRSPTPRVLTRAGRTLGLVGAILLAGCHYADKFAPQSAEFNVQAAAIKSQDLLVNIMRAAYREPLQFTDLTTVTGTTSVSANAGFNLPVAGPSFSYPRLFQFNPTLIASESPSYTVAVLNTKEFYEGILTPIPPQLLAYYIGIGMPRALLLTLMVAEIQYGPADAVRHVYNRADSGGATYQEFQKLLGELLDLGLTVAAVHEHTAIGPPFDEKGLPAPKDAVALEGQGIKAVRHSLAEAGASLPPDQQVAFRKAGYYYQLEKTSVTYRFCFDRSLARSGVELQPGMAIGDTGEVLDPSAICGPAAARSAAKQPTGENSLQGAASDTSGSAAPTRVFTFSVRSTEAVIYFLGELMRHDLGLAPPRFTPTIVSDSGPSVLFHIAPGSGDGIAIDAHFDGRDYHIAVDPTGRDRSSQVLDLLTELLAQNNSAKDLPAPSVIPIAPH